LPPDAPQDRPATRRQVLRPGSCDGHNPNYTEAFDIAGVRAAARLARALGKDDDVRTWTALAAQLSRVYDDKFGSKLAAGYGSYAVLWPCALYPLGDGPAHAQFRQIGAQQPTGWRYFPLATAHQGLLAGNRQAGHGTVERHLQHEQCAGWYALDEGGNSGPGGWRFYRTTWKAGVAMPHGWAIAELWLLLRDCLVFEDGDRLVLLGGVPEAWWTAAAGIRIDQLPTHFGPLGLHYQTAAQRATLSLTGRAAPPQGFVLRVPGALPVTVTADGQPVPRGAHGNFVLPPATREVRLAWGP